MAVSRRRFLSTTTTIGAAATATTLIEAQSERAAHAKDRAGVAAPVQPSAVAAALPPLAVIALNRIGYGPHPGDVAAFNALGATDDARLAAYVEQQLNPVERRRYRL